MTLEYGEIILKAARDSKPNAINVEEKCDAVGHCVMSDWTVAICRRPAGEHTI